MPVDISAYNVVPNSRQYNEAQAQAQKQKELTNKTGLSDSELAYLQSKGVNPNKIISMQSQGYSKNSILYLAEEGKNPQMSKTGINMLNRIVAGETVKFSAGEFDADRGTYSGYNNKYALYELGKVFNLRIGHEQYIVFSNGTVYYPTATTRELLRYAPGEAGKIQSEIDVQTALSAQRRAIAAQITEEETKAGPEYQSHYDAAKNMIITEKKPEFTIEKYIQPKAGEEIKVVLGTGKTVPFSQLPPSLQSEVRGDIESQLNVQTSGFYGFTGRYYELNPKGTLMDTGLAGRIRENPSAFGLGATTVFGPYGGATLTPKGWVQEKYPYLAEWAGKVKPIEKQTEQISYKINMQPISLKLQETQNIKDVGSLILSLDTQYQKLISSGENLITKQFPFLPSMA